MRSDNSSAVIHNVFSSPRRLVCAVAVVLALVATSALAQPGGGGGGTTCTPSATCITNGVGGSCHTVDGMSAVCGTCRTVNGCTTPQCQANTDQTGCTAEQVTCSKVSTDADNDITQACGHTTIFTGADELKQPTAVRSVAGSGAVEVTLTVKYAVVNATAFSFNSRLYCLGTGSSAVCSAPAPTIEFYPGDTVTVTIINDLPAEEAAQSSFQENTLRAPQTVNLHTHGLHVDQRDDNVMYPVPPQKNKTYVYRIPSDHLPGMHWYHTHAHGSSTMHLLGGMTGTLRTIETDAQRSAISASYAAMGEGTILHFSHHSLCSCNGAGGMFAIHPYPHLGILMGDPQPLGYVQHAGHTVSDVVLTNGQYQPKTTMLVNDWHRFEMINAVGDIYLEIEIGTSVGSTTTASECSILVLSIDGVYLRNGPRSQTPVLVSIAGRVGIAVKCNAAGTYYLQTNARGRASDFEAGFTQNLLTLNVVASGVTSNGATATPTWGSSSITWPFYLTDLSSTTASASWQLSTAQGGVVAPASNHLGIGTNCAGRDPVDCIFQSFLYSGSFRHTAPVCSVVEWTINGGGATGHPIHFHAHHYQLQSFSGNNLARWGEIGDWRDTWPAINGAMVVKYRADAFIGPVMVHCHYLFHEDQGMMDRVWTGTASASACTASSTQTSCDSVIPSEAFSNVFAAMASVECNPNAATTATPPTTPTTTSAPPSVVSTNSPAVGNSDSNTGAASLTAVLGSFTLLLICLVL